MENNTQQTPYVPANELVIGFWGFMGGGKTLNMTKWAILLAESSGRPIYANYHINHKQAHYFTNFKELEHITHAIVVYDEIHVDFDCRGWDKKGQQAFTHWFTQTRKKYITFLYATQSIDQLEKRVRNNTQYLFCCTKNKRKELKEELYNTQLGMANAIKISTRILAKPYLIWPYFDTSEVIKEKYYND